MEYVPDGILGTEYAPDALVTTSRLRFVSVCVATTVAPGSAAPVVSTTFPTSDAYTLCAIAESAVSATHATAVSITRASNPFMIFFLLVLLFGFLSRDPVARFV